MSILKNKLLTTEMFNQDFHLEKVLSQNYDIVSHEGVVHLESKMGVPIDIQTSSRSSTPPISDPNNASDHMLQGSAPRNPKDGDKQDLLMNESEVEADSRMNTKFQSISSQIGLLNEQPLSPLRRLGVSLAHPPNMTYLGVSQDGFTPGSHLERSSHHIPTNYFHTGSRPPHKDLLRPTYGPHHITPPGQRILQNPFTNPASSSYLMDNVVGEVSIEPFFPTTSGLQQPLSPTNQSVCQLRNPDGKVCGQAISTEMVSEHLVSAHREIYMP